MSNSNSTRREQQRTQRGQNLMDLTEEQAREYIESLIWPDGEPVCRKCGSLNCYKMEGKTCRPGLHRCRDCKKQFTATVGTIFEDTKVPLRLWVRAFHLMCSSKKGISALQLQRNLGLGSYRTAWHMAHRIRHAMANGPEAHRLTGIIESDESYCGGKPRKTNRLGHRKNGQNKSTKIPVHTLVERDGNKRTKVVPNVRAHTLKANLEAMVDKSAEIHTDENRAYRKAAAGFAGHEKVNHSFYEFHRVEKGKTITTNSAECSFSLLKRGLYGVFHHVSEEHLQRYLDEFDYRWNHRKVSDVDRTKSAIKQANGTRLKYDGPVARG